MTEEEPKEKVTIQQWKNQAKKGYLSPKGLLRLIDLIELDGTETLKQERDRWLSETPPTPNLSTKKDGE